MRLPNPLKFLRRDDNIARIANSEGLYDVEREFNLTPIGIYDALRSELITAAQIIWGRAMREPEYVTELEPGEPMPPSEAFSRFEMLMRQPNPESNFLDLIGRTGASMNIMGRYYWVKVSQPNMATSSIWGISRENMQVERDTNGMPVSYHVVSSSLTPLQRSSLLQSNPALTFSPSQVVVFDLLKSELGTLERGDGADAVYPLESLRSVLTLDARATARATTLMAIGAGIAVSPTDAEAMKKMGPESLKALLDAAGKAFEKLKAATAEGSPVYFPQPVKVEQVGFDPTKMMPPAIADRPESRVSSICGIPAPLIGFELGTKGGQAYASLEIQRKFFAEGAQLSTLKYISFVITNDVLREFLPVGQFTFREDTIRALQEDMGEVHNRALAAFAAGAITNHQYAMLVGFPEPEGEPVYSVPSSAAIVTESEYLSGMAMESVEPDPPPMDDDAEDADPEDDE